MPYTPYQSTWQNPYMPQVQQPQYSPVVPSVTTPYTQPVNGITKVNGRDSALQYSLPPNSMSPALFDNNGKTFYIVSTDGTGMKTVEAFDFSPHKEEQPISIDGAQFVSRQEYDSFVAKVSAALEAINGVHATVPAGSAANGTQGQNVNAQANDARRPVRADYQPMPE
jgi:hypothetical protein